MPWIGFVFLMGHMSVSHVYRHYVNDADIVDITGAQMVLVMKLCAFCWNVHDGRLPDEDLEEFQRDRAIKELPGLLDYAGYVLFFPSLMAGPAFDYVEYRRWLETTMFELPPGTDPSKAPKTRKKRRIPRSGTPATIKALKGVMWVLIYLKLAGMYPIGIVLDGRNAQYSLARRMFILHMINFTNRTKYYGVWFLAEGSCILSGIGYKGLNTKTGRPDWDRLQNVNPLGIELAQNSRAYLGNWNMNTNNWLRNYMYLRVTPKGKKPGFVASLATFLTSALWHGFEPGYYLTFVLAAFIQAVAKSEHRLSESSSCNLLTPDTTDTRRLIRPFFLSPTTLTSLPTKIYYDIFSWLMTQLAFTFCTTPFIALSLTDSLNAWRGVDFYCIIGVAIALGAFADASPIRRYLKVRLAKRGGGGRKKAEELSDKSEGHETEDHGHGMATSTSSAYSRSLQDCDPLDTAENSAGEDNDTDSLHSTSQPHDADTLRHRSSRPRFLDGTGASGYNAARHGAMGVSDDPGRDFDDLIEQVREEVRIRRGRGLSMGPSLQAAVQERFGSGVSARVDREGNVDVDVRRM